MITLTLPFAPKVRPAKGGVVRRVVMGGKLSDLNRLPRYFVRPEQLVGL